MTTIHEIENMSFEELKAQRAKNLEALKAVPVEELTTRYFQARTDAKQRDEKLSEQGVTISSLQDGMEALKESRDAVQAEVSQLRDTIKSLEEANRILVRENKDQAAKTVEDMVIYNKAIEVKTGIIERLKIQADKYAAAVSGIHKLSLDAINSQAIEDAEVGR